MTDATHDQLEQAYRLINNDELDKALAILKPIVAAQPDNADAWWLLANAVSDPHEAQNALTNVLRVNPNHAEAREQRDALVREFPDLASSATPAGSSQNLDDLFGSSAESSDFGSLDDLFGSTSEPAGSMAASPDFGSYEPASSPDADLDALFSPGSAFQPDADLDTMFGDVNRQLDILDEDPFAASSKEPEFIREAIEPAPEAKPAKGEPKPKAAKTPKPPKEPKAPKVKEPPAPLDPFEIERRANSRTSPFVRILLVLLVVIIVGGGIGAAYLSGLFGNRGADQTPVPVTGVAQVATSAATSAATEAAAGGPFQSIIQAFTASQYTDVQASVVQSSLGDTLQVQVCGAPGPNLQTKVNTAMDMIATEAVKMRDTIQGAGIQVVSCARPDVMLYRAVAPISAVTAYVEGGMKDHRTFRAAWKTT